jgi:hypothetical protein
MDNYKMARNNFELAVTHRMQSPYDPTFSMKAMILYKEAISCLLKHLLDIDAVEYDQSECITSLASRTASLFTPQFYQQICSMDSLPIGNYAYDDYQMSVVEGYVETLKFQVDNKILEDGAEYERLDWKEIEEKYAFQFVGLVNVVYNEKRDIVSAVVKYTGNTEQGMKARQMMEPSLVVVSVK